MFKRSLSISLFICCLSCANQSMSSVNNATSRVTMTGSFIPDTVTFQRYKIICDLENGKKHTEESKSVITQDKYEELRKCNNKNKEDVKIIESKCEVFLPMLILMSLHSDKTCATWWNGPHFCSYDGKFISPNWWHFDNILDGQDDFKKEISDLSKDFCPNLYSPNISDKKKKKHETMIANYQKRTNKRTKHGSKKSNRKKRRSRFRK